MRTIFAAAVSLIAIAAPAAAYDDPRTWSCSDLWSNRNQIYKSNGYCFRTPRAIREFGNGGCQYNDIDDVPLSASQRRYVAEMVRAERIKGCPR
jgi:YARHG domain